MEMLKIKGVVVKEGDFWYLKHENNEFIKDECDEIYDAGGLLTEIDSLSDFNAKDGDKIEITITRKA